MVKLDNPHFDLYWSDDEEDEVSFEPMYRCGFCDEEVPISQDTRHINGRCLNESSRTLRVNEGTE